MLDIIILAIICAYLFSKLYSALGDNEHNREMSKEEIEARREFVKSFANKSEVDEKKELLQTIDISNRNEKSDYPECYKVFEQIRSKDASFSAANFEAKAKKAYSYILECLITREVDILEELLTPDILQVFKESIEENKRSRESLNVHIIGFKSAKIIFAKSIHGVVYLSVRFAIDQIIFTTKGPDADLVSGSKEMETVIEVWTFCKKISDIDTIWKLTSTDKNFQNEIS